MSTATEESAPGTPAAQAPPEDSLCQQCRAALTPDQEWCLECGAARTLIHRAPDWRVPVAVVGGVVLLVLAAFAIALVNLSSDANRSATTVTVTAAAKSPPRHAVAKAKAPATTQPSIASWSVGLPGWTVVVASRRKQPLAVAVARRFAGRGVSVGILHSSDHPNLIPGFWIVFSGRYPTEEAATAHANALIAAGYKRAHVRLVARPGQ